MAFALPDGFRFGVATSGFQTEGGYNGPGQPANNWLDWERSGRVEPVGIALDFWNRYEEHLDRAVAAGCDAFRISVEWARCEPSEGEVDTCAFDRYAAILDACADRGVEPVVALHHFTHPRWLGPDFWLQLDSPERFGAWAAIAADRLGDRCRRWLTMNEPNGLAVQTYVMGALPPARRLAQGDFVRALDHLLTAHVLAHREIHRRRPDAVVSTNNSASSIYELDRLLVDVLLAPGHGVPRADLGEWLAGRRAEYHAGLGRPERLDAALRRVVAGVVPLDKALPRAVDAAYRAHPARALDAVQIDYYDPVACHHLRVPRHRWDDRVHPRGLSTWLRANVEPGLGVEVAENGLCNRVSGNQPQPRGDGWDRVRFLRANLAAVVASIESGVPVTGYFHWTLADSYEWGSYQPRYGLYGVERRSDSVRLRDTDWFGGDAAGAYRRFADGLRAGDVDVLRR